MNMKRFLTRIIMPATALGALGAMSAGAQQAEPSATDETPAAPVTAPAPAAAPTPAPAAAPTLAPAQAATTAPTPGAAAVPPSPVGNGGESALAAPANAAAQTVAAAITASPDHSTLANAVRQAGLVETLSGPGPFTLFAPTNDAFIAYGQETVDALMQPAARAQLSEILRYHVVSGALDVAAITAQAEAGGGVTTLTSVEGSPLIVRLDQGAISITDERGGTIFVSVADMRHSNGIVHSTNGVLFTAVSAEAAASTAAAQPTIDPAPEGQ